MRALIPVLLSFFTATLLLARGRLLCVGAGASAARPGEILMLRVPLDSGTSVAVSLMCSVFSGLWVVLASISAAHAAGAGAPFRDAVAVWHMADLSDSSGGDSPLTASGSVRLGVALPGAEREESLRRGGDGRVAVFEGGWLDAGQGAGGELKLKSNALTVCVRLRDPSGTLNCPLFSKHGGHDQLVYNIFSTDLGAGMVIGFELGTTGGMTQVYTPLAMIGPGEWHDILCRYDGAKVQMFMDGVWMDEGFPLGTLRRGNLEPCLIGAESVGGKVKSGYRGMIDHVALWDRALSDAEIEALSGGREHAVARRRQMLGEPGPMQYFKPHNQFNVGDTFPFFHDGVFHFYYLLDRGHHSSKGGYGAHQWAHASSRDLVHWEHHPLAVPITEQHEGSICTGSVFFHEGTYYAFYATRIVGKGEHLSLAVSKDGIHFTKTQPNPFLSPGAKYTQDFRDPHVFLDQRTGLFHLLVTSVLKEGHRGCLAHYTSTDLRDWHEEGEPFYVEGTGALECSEHFEWNGQYYLVFNGCYRMSRAPLGPWSKPKVDRFDGPLFAVPKTAVFAGTRRIVTAWLAHKGWGDRAVFREVVQHPDGTLGAKFLPEMILSSPDAVALAFKGETDGVSGDARRITIHSPQGIGVASLTGLPSNARISLRVTPAAGVRFLGLRLRDGGAQQPAHELRFVPAEQRVQVVGGQALQNVEGLDRPFSLEIILKDDILDVCVDNRRTLINVVPELKGDRLVLFAEKGDAVFDAIEVRPLRSDPAR